MHLLAITWPQNNNTVGITMLDVRYVLQVPEVAERFTEIKQSGLEIVGNGTNLFIVIFIDARMVYLRCSFISIFDGTTPEELEVWIQRTCKDFPEIQITPYR